MSIPDPVVLLDARARYVHPAFQMSRASTKTVFDATGKLVTVPANAIGWDHDPATGQARGYLPEPSATNLLLHSNDVTQGAWAKGNLSVSAAAIIGPDGSGMAKLVENSAYAGRSLRQTFTIGDGDTIAAHFIAKAGERGSVQFLLRQEASGTDYFVIRAYLTGDGSFDNLTAIGAATVIDGGITHLGEGFYHIWLVGTLGAGITDARLVIAMLDGSGNTSYQGDGTSGLYVGYCQAEPGSYPTSYIETGAATATRARDELTCSTSSLPWRNSRGTVVIDTDIRWWLAAAIIFSWGTDIIARIGVNNDALYVFGDNLSGNRTLTSSLGKLRLALTWDEDEVAAAVNGALISNPVPITSPLSSGTIGVGNRWSGSDSWNGPVHRAVYYPARLSNADLQSLTAIQE